MRIGYLENINVAGKGVVIDQDLGIFHLCLRMVEGEIQVIVIFLCNEGEGGCLVECDLHELVAGALGAAEDAGLCIKDIKVDCNTLVVSLA